MMNFEMSKHVALNDVYIVVLTVCLHNNYRCWVCGCELNRSRCCEYYYVNEFPFRNFSAVSTMKPQFTAPLLFTVTAATCGERNRVFLLLVQEHSGFMWRDVWLDPSNAGAMNSALHMQLLRHACNVGCTHT